MDTGISATFLSKQPTKKPLPIGRCLPRITVDYDTIKARCDSFDGLALYAGQAGLVDIINGNGRMRGMEQTFVDLITDDPAGLLLMDRRLGIDLEVTLRTIEAARGRIDFLWIGEDLGSQHSPLIGMDVFLKHIRPRHQEFIDMAKSFGLPVMVHTCGSSSWAYNEFIEMGIDVVDTLQPEAANMSPEHLKRTSGDRLAFHGCISTARAGCLRNGRRRDKGLRATLESNDAGRADYCFAPPMPSRITRPRKT